MEMNIKYITPHCHSGISNASRGFPDSSIKLEDLVMKAKEKGLGGIAITDHECVGSFVFAKELEKKYDFPVLLGNEIYLVSDWQYDMLKNDYQQGMYFPHFILIAKDKIGAFQLMKLSTKAWVDNSFTSRGLMRTPTKMSDIEEVIGDDKGHIIASSACLGGSIPKLLMSARDNPDRQETVDNGIFAFIEWCQDVFLKENFFLEVQPATEHQVDQLYVNNKIKELSKLYEIPYIISTDVHYLDAELLPIHEKFLNSKETDDREVMDFYRTAYLMSSQEIYDIMSPYWTYEEIEEGLNNTIKIGDMCERYDFNRKQVVPQIEFEPNWEDKVTKDFYPFEYFYIYLMVNSKHYQDRYLMYKLENGIRNLIDTEDYEATFLRLEEELAEIWHISNGIGDRIGNYFITMSKIIEIMWDRNGGDSLVGTGRGSGVASIIDYLLEITQLNPIKMSMDMPFYRFMTRERAELPDLDIDSQSNRRNQIFEAVYNYFVTKGGDMVHCCTYGVYGAKSAIKTAGRGLGLSSDDCSVVASLIPTVRGFTLSLDECYLGNEDKDLKPIKEFVNAVDKFPSLFDTAKLIEGVFINRGVHASGVFITNTPFTDFGAKMKSPKGIITSQWELHQSELAGSLKYDFLTVSALDKIRLTLELLMNNGHIEKQETLKKTYMKYVNPMELPYDSEKGWESIQNNDVADLFQFDSMVAMDAVSKIKPSNLIELMQTNSLMRLQQQEGATETPVETYARFKTDKTAWERELDDWNVPQKDRVYLREILEIYNGVADTQEGMMALVRHRNISDFNVTEAHFARKVVAKKSAKDLVKLKALFFKKASGLISETTLNYLWEVQIMRQASYSFSILHTLAYTFIALIELTLYTNYPSIYWNCACLTINAEAMDEESNDDDEDDIWASNSEIEIVEDDEDSNDEEEEKINKGKSTDYGKTASAIAKMQTRGIKIALPDINTSEMSFIPNEKDNLIMFGMKAIVGINSEMVRDIMKSRPYADFNDFYCKMVETKREVTNNNGKTQKKSLVPNGKVITLIKAGMFDNLVDKSRQEVMKDLILKVNPPKKSNTLANLDKIIEMGIIPNEYDLAVRFYRFKKFVGSKSNFIKQDEKAKSKKWYIIKGVNDTITAMATEFFNEYFGSVKEDVDFYYDADGNIIVLLGADSCEFDKVVNKNIEPLKEWLNSDDCLSRVNELNFQEEWSKATSNSDSLSKWEMDSVGFYYHDHELSLVDNEHYGVVDFFNLSEEPVIVGYNEWKTIKYPKHEISRICGTVVSRDKTKHIVQLLTTTGVVSVKYDGGQFGHYDKQISYLDNGKKVTLENGWFRKGTKLIICGYRKGDRFKPKKYKDTLWSHTTMLIEGIDESNGKLFIKSERSRI